jgi:hypothetical protein
VTVNFTANPRPVRVAWKLDDGSELAVEPFTGRASTERIDVIELRNTVRCFNYAGLNSTHTTYHLFIKKKKQNASSYEARLRIKSVSEADARRLFRLIVESDLNSELYTQEYTVRISMSAAPLQCNNPNQSDCTTQVRTVDFRSDLAGGVSGGGIAAIIIVLVAVLVVTAVVLYARNTGRWCFAG